MFIEMKEITKYNICSSFLNKYGHLESINPLTIWNDSFMWCLWYFVKADNREEILEYLIKSNINIDYQNRSKESILMYASIYNYIDAVRLLINANANVNLRHEDNTTALMFAVKHNNFKIVELLIKTGADISVRTSYKATALDMANILKFRDIANILVKAGAGDV